MNRVLLEIYIIYKSIWFFIYNHTFRHILVWKDKRSVYRINDVEFWYCEECNDIIEKEVVIYDHGFVCCPECGNFLVLLSRSFEDDE